MLRFRQFRRLAPPLLATAFTLVAHDEGGNEPPEPTIRQVLATDDLPRLELVEPGTRIGSGAPPGWTHLVVKSIPRLATGDLGTLPGVASETARMIHTLVLSEVRGGVVRRVGLGLCLPDGEGEVVATAASLHSLGIHLGPIPRLVLDRGGRDLARSQLLAQTPTFAALETPTKFVLGGKHREVRLRHAVLVVPGDLKGFIWVVEPGVSGSRLVREPVELPPACLSDCALDVAAVRVLGAVPVNWSFAMCSLPPGRPLAMTPELRAWASSGPLTRDDSALFERHLRASLPPETGSQTAPRRGPIAP